LCRCTGYRPILEAFSTFSKNDPSIQRTPENGDKCVPTYNKSSFKEYISEPFNEAILKEMKLISGKKVLLTRHNGTVSWFKPTSLASAYDFLEKHPTAQLRQGGTGHYKKFEKKKLRNIVDLSGISDLKIIEKQSSGFKIGSGVSFTKLRMFLSNVIANESEGGISFFEELSAIVDNLATEQVRNVATVGGHIMWAHPASDIIPLLIVSGATMAIGMVRREISVADYFRSKEKLKEGEILLHICLPVKWISFFRKDHKKVRFFNHRRRKTADLSIANMAIAFDEPEPGVLQNVEIVIGGIGMAVKQSNTQPILFATNTSQLLSSTELEN
jgi:xanthine dehydrogenase iron-sulfur cluster and FAD-binding subunit A